MSDADSAVSRRRLAAKRRNERVKLLANTSNALALGIIGATLIVPELSGSGVRMSAGPFDWFRAFWILAAVVLHILAQLAFELMQGED